MRQRLDSELEKNIAGSKILLVDEVDDSRRTLEKACDYLLGLKVSEVRILVVHSKDKEKAGVIPENVKLYFGEKTPPLWIEYPWG
jgi:hypoxanthine phosphoribosyltransferase